MPARKRAVAAALFLLVAALMFTCGCARQQRSGAVQPTQSHSTQPLSLNDVVSMSRAYLGSEPAVPSRPDESSLTVDRESSTTLEPTGTPPAPAPSPSPTPPAVPSGKRFVVVIDPGHQAKPDLRGERVAPWSSETKPRVTAGATGVTTGVTESELMLELANSLKRFLERSGITVILTRTRNDVNVSNRQRAEVANSVSATLFVRLHANSSTNRADHGAMMICQPARRELDGIYQKSLEAGRIIFDAYRAETGLANAGLVQRADLTGLNWSRSPAVLIELGYLSNLATL
jgi:N-acetylmuramoyl-L-alanine amidase